jgi:predicted transcriptional regulator
MAISEQEVRIYRVLVAKPDRWMTNREIGQAAEVPAKRTVSHTTSKLAKMGLLQEVSVAYPGHRYRWAGLTEHPYLEALQGAESVFAQCRQGEAGQGTRH